MDVAPETIEDLKALARLFNRIEGVDAKVGEGRGKPTFEWNSRRGGRNCCRLPNEMMTSFFVGRILDALDLAERVHLVGG